MDFAIVPNRYSPPAILPREGRRVGIHGIRTGKPGNRPAAEDAVHG